MLAFGRKLLLISSFIVMIWIIIGILIYKSTFQNEGENERLNPKFLHQKSNQCEKFKESSGFWKSVNLQEKTIPESVSKALSIINIHSNFVTIEGTKIHYSFAKPSVITSDMVSVLLLHGQSYTSETWNELGTIKLLAAMGHFPIALDLPGYGKTPSIPSLGKASFIDQFISETHLNKPVIVSPSMSGLFSLKFLIKHPDKLGGFIPVSPVKTDILNESPCKGDKEGKDAPLTGDCQKINNLLNGKQPNLNCLKIPSLIVWGEKDRGENSAKLCLLPESQGVEIPEGNHAAYLSNPDLWHKLLYNFLSLLSEMQACKAN